MMMYVVLGSLFLLFIGFFVLLIVRSIEGNKRREITELRQRLEEHEREQLAMWSESQHVHDLVDIYARMLKKHGPKSEEARQFRFGVENQQLSADKKALKAFNSIADILQNAWSN